MAIVIYMDGVLRSEQRVPIYEGIALYKSLNANGVVMLAVEDQEEALRWCKEHRLNELDGFISDKTVGNYPDKEYLKVQHQQSSGPVYLAITADVELSKKLLENGVKTLLFLHPVYFNAKFRPDGRSGRKSWGELVGELDRQIDMSVEDNRL